jgi:hypothetical protein
MTTAQMAAADATGARQPHMSAAVASDPNRLAAARGMLAELAQLAAEQDAVVPFGKIVQARSVARLPELHDEARAVERALVTAFERTEGRIQNAYYSRTAVGGVALAGPPPAVPGAAPRPALALHTVLNTDNERLNALEARCGEVFDQIAERGLARPTTQLPVRQAAAAVYDVMTNVLAAADQFAKDPKSPRLPALVRSARIDLAAARRRADVIVQRRARAVYVQGMLAGVLLMLGVTVALGLLNAHLWWRVITTAPLVLSVAMGSLGAVVSVFQRMSKGTLVLDPSSAESEIRAVAVLRPVAGGVFGAVAQFALSGGLLAPSVYNSTSGVLGIVAVSAFASGFSERFAIDMVERAGKVLLTDGQDNVHRHKRGQQPPHRKRPRERAPADRTDERSDERSGQRSGQRHDPDGAG